MVILWYDVDHHHHHHHHHDNHLLQKINILQVYEAPGMTLLGHALDCVALVGEFGSAVDPVVVTGCWSRHVDI